MPRVQYTTDQYTAAHHRVGGTNASAADANPDGIEEEILDDFGAQGLPKTLFSVYVTTTSSNRIKQNSNTVLNKRRRVQQAPRYADA